MAKLIIKWLKIYSGKNITSVPCGQFLPRLIQLQMHCIYRVGMTFVYEGRAGECKQKFVRVVLYTNTDSACQTSEKNQCGVRGREGKNTHG